MASQANNLNWFNSGRNSSSNLFSPAPTNVYTPQTPEGLKINSAWAEPLTPSASPTIDMNAYAGNYPNAFTPNSPGAQSPRTTQGKTSSTVAPANTPATTPTNSNPYNLVPNLWNTNVTAGTVDVTGAPSGTTNFSSAASPNINYPTADAAKQMGQMFGANVYQQNLGGNYGPAGAPSAPMYGLDFGIGDPQNAGQVAFWLQRGDKPEDIMARLQAGIFTPYGVGIRDNMGQSWDTANPLFTTTTPGVGTLTAGKTATVNPGQPLGGVQGIGQNNPFYNGTVNTGLAPATPTTPTTPPTPATPTTPQSSAIDWSLWMQLLNSLYYPAAEGANTSAFLQNITPAMRNTASGNSYLPQTTTTSPGATGSMASSFGAGGVNTLLNLLRGGNTPTSVNPILAAYLQNLLFSPNMG